MAAKDFNSILDHKQKVAGPHFLFSAENPKYAQHNKLGLNHEQALGRLQSEGYDAHAVDGHYGAPEKSIIVYGVNPQHAERLHQVASNLGQDSSIYSTGKQHEMRFHHGDDAGKKFLGQGTDWHPEKPADFYTSLPGGIHNFTHNFDFENPVHPQQQKMKIAKSETLVKGADENEYKRNAEKGMDLIFPVSVKGKTHRPDINVRYHNSIKIFDPDKDSHNDVHAIAHHLDMDPPDPKEVGIEPIELTGRTGYKMHALRMHGPHADAIKEHNKAFEGKGHPQNYEYHPHVTVDKATWDEVKAKGHKTAHEAGIEFHQPELRQGSKIVARYHKKPEKMAASEAQVNDLEKGAIKNTAIALGMVGSLASTPNFQHDGTRGQAVAAVQKPEYSRKKMLDTIAQVESNRGKYENHKELGGINAGDHAYGKYALTPNTIRETIKLNPDLKNKYKQAAALKGPELNNFMRDNPGLEDTIADKHLARLEHHFGPNPETIGYSWLNGVTGTNKALKAHKDISKHWHVKKIRDAYSRGK